MIFGINVSSYITNQFWVNWFFNYFREHLLGLRLVFKFESMSFPLTSYLKKLLK